MPPQNKRDLIASIPYLHGMSPSLVDEVSRSAQEIRLGTGEVLLTIGEPCEGLYAVFSGAVKVTRISQEGREQVMTVIRAGETFNDVPVFDYGKCPATVIALEETVVYMAPVSVMRELIRSNPDVASRTLQVFAARLRGLVNLVADLTHLDVPTRVARALITYSQQSGSISLDINQSDLAVMVGTTREGVARALKRLEDEGVVTRRRGIIDIGDADGLRRAAGLSGAGGPP